jgi:hypothetical protein
LELDPNNLPALLLLTQALSQEDPLQARAMAERLIAVEDTPYFKVRALPEIVPTETYSARLYLGSVAKDPKQRELQLRAGVEGFLRYAASTVPAVRRMPDGMPYGGETKQSATEKLQYGLSGAKALEDIYRSSGDKSGADWASGAARDLSSALESLSASER